MSKDIEAMLNNGPELTLGPLDEAVPELKTEGAELAVEAGPKEVLTPEEEKQVADFAGKIDLKDSNLVLQYGAGAQKKIADFSESALDNVKSKDLGEVGQMLSQVVTELKGFEIEEEDKGFFGLFKKGTNRLEGMKAKYAKAETNVNQICKVLQNHQIQLLKDVALLDKMYDLNTVYFKELTMYILAGKRKLEKVRREELPVLMEKAGKSGLPEDAQAANDLASMCGRFEKKLHDLELTRMISIQMAPQIRLVQNNDTLMTEKIQSTLVNTIPLWKSQMVLAIGINHSEQAARAQREVSDMTNELLKKNAEVLKTSTIQTAKESERGIVDMETLKKTNESLITTLDEVVRIQEEGRARRREAESELGRLEGELKAKLLQMSR
ncbi:toxic anion resistance protein [Lacrimispora sp.]|uniref:toxic anion resistance protein n=1 Tax=Lacrimispora sp. TaxID=2719234 RepID=UPI00345FB5AE